MAFLKNDKLMMIGKGGGGDGQIQKFHRKVLLKITSGLKNSTGYVFDSRNSKGTSKLHQNLLVLSYRKILSKFTMQYIPVKKKKM